MKVVVERDKIIEGLQKAAGIVAAKSGAAYLRSIWLKAEGSTLSLMCTDANVEFTGKYEAEVESGGLVGVMGRYFADLARRLPSGPISLGMEEGASNLLVEQGRSSYRLPVSNPDWFQPFSEFPAEGSTPWAGDFLREIIERVSFCISDEEAQDAVSCVFFNPRENGRVDACGLNGHQFAMSSFINDDIHALLGDKGLLIQKKHLQYIKNWLDKDEFEISVAAKRVYLRRMDGSETLSLPRALYEYPDYNVFVSKMGGGSGGFLELDRKNAAEALGRIVVFNTENERCVYLDLREAEVALSAQGADVGSARETLEASYRGEIERIGFPTKQLLDIFEHFESQILRLEFTGVEGPCGITGISAADADYLVIVMPMKISEKDYYEEDEK